MNLEQVAWLLFVSISLIGMKVMILIISFIWKINGINNIWTMPCMYKYSTLAYYYNYKDFSSYSFRFKTQSLIWKTNSYKFWKFPWNTGNPGNKKAYRTSTLNWKKLFNGHKTPHSILYSSLILYGGDEEECLQMKRWKNLYHHFFIKPLSYVSCPF